MREHLAKKSSDHLNSGGQVDVSLITMWAGMIAVLDAHLTRLAVTVFDDAGLDEVKRSAHQDMRKLYQLREERNAAAEREAWLNGQASTK